ncbi:MAG TPA: Gldg family protein [Spirochaetota bacterium]|nr:Gldg family protein [Spirochaetota bacterium]
MKFQDITKTVREWIGPAWSVLRETLNLSGTENRKKVQLILNIVIIVLINVVGLTMNFRCDLTRNDTYSLSDKSREIVSNLKENLKIKVLFSKDMPAQHTAIFRYLKDLLEEYDYYANEYFSYEIIDDKDLVKAAADYGIRPVQSQELDKDQVKVRRTYMGLVIQQSDVVEKIEAITEPTGLEYNITSLIEKMSSKIDGLLSLKEPIKVMLYMDSALAALPIDGIDTLKEKVAAAVDKCNAGNYDKLRFEFIDPSVDKNASVTADLYGVPRLKWKAGQDRSGKFIPAGDASFGIVLKLNNRAAIIDISIAPTITGRNVITGLDQLEDRINNSVGTMVSSNPRIGYITGHGEVELNDQQSPQGGAILRQVLSDVYDVQEIDLAAGDIPADLGLVIVNGPRKAYTDQEAYKIDQFLMKGKAALFFLDSFNEISLGGQNMMGQQPVVVPVDTGLDGLLRAYGVIVNKNIVLDSSCARGNVNGAIKEFYHVPMIRKAGFDQENVVSKYLKGLAMIKVSSVDIDTAAAKRLKLSHATLVSSSDESWQMAGQVNFNPFFMMPPENEKEMARYGLAVLVAGKFDSFYKGRAVPGPAAGGKMEAAETITVQKLEKTVPSGTTKIIVVGSSEITRSYFLMNAKRIISSALSDPNDQDKIFANGFFIHSMADYLLGNVYIPEMSSKSLDYNPLDVSSDGTKLALKAVNIAGVPLLVILAGLLIWKRRSRRKKSIQERFAREVHHG